MNPNNNNKSLLGIDIADDCIRFVETTFQNSHFKIINFNTFEKSTLHGKQLKYFTKKSNIKFYSKYTAVAINAHDALIEVIRLNKIQQQDLKKNVLKEMQKRISISLSELSYDFYILNQHSENDIEKADHIEVMFVATRITLIQKKIDEILSMGLYPVIIDIDTFAKERAKKYLLKYKLNIVSENTKFYAESFLLALGLSMRVKNACY